MAAPGPERMGPAPSRVCDNVSSRGAHAPGTEKEALGWERW